MEVSEICQLYCKLPLLTLARLLTWSYRVLQLIISENDHFLSNWCIPMVFTRFPIIYRESKKTLSKTPPNKRSLNKTKKLHAQTAMWLVFPQSFARQQREIRIFQVYTERFCPTFNCFGKFQGKYY